MAETLFFCEVPKLRAFVQYWLIVVIWMAVIFSASSDRMSFQHSSRFLGPLVRWLMPQLPEPSVREVVFIIRKCAHFVEFAVLAFLLWRALRKPQPKESRPWEWRSALIALVLVAAYAVTDELHQRFVPSRQASAVDVVIDSSGAVLALIIVWGFGRLRRRW